MKYKNSQANDTFPGGMLIIQFIMSTVPNQRAQGSIIDRSYRIKGALAFIIVFNRS